MSLLRECPYCGAALDPGERCDCGLRDYESKAMAAVVSGHYRGLGGRPMTAPTKEEKAGLGAGTPEPAKADD